MKNLFKKSMSVFLSILMLLSCWVFVPGEHHMHAEAAASSTTYKKDKDKYGTPAWSGTNSYYVHYSNGNNKLWVYFPTQIYLDVSETLQSAGYTMNIKFEFGQDSNYRLLLGGPIWCDYKDTGINQSKYPKYYAFTDIFSDYAVDSSFASGGSKEYSGSGTDYDLRVNTRFDSDSDSFTEDGVTHKTYVIYRPTKAALPHTATLYLKGTPNSSYVGKTTEFNTTGTSAGSYGMAQQWKKNTWSNRDDSGSKMLNNKWGSGTYSYDNWPEMVCNITVYDKSKLNDAINDANNIINNYSYRYTKASLNNLKTVLDNNKGTLTKREVVQGSDTSKNSNEINGAKNNILEAINGLKRTYDLTYENLFSYSDFINTDSVTVDGGGANASGSKIEYDFNAGTIKATTGSGEVFTTSNSSGEMYNIPVEAGTEYKLDYDVEYKGNVQTFVFFYNNAGQQVKVPGSDNYFYNNYEGKPITFTVPKGATKIGFRFGTYGSSGNYANFSNIRLYETSRQDIVDAAKAQGINRVVYAAGDSITALGALERTGYTFDKWVCKDGSAMPTTANNSYVIYSSYKNSVPFDVNYDNIFSFSEWADSYNRLNIGSGVSLKIDGTAGTINIVDSSSTDADVYTYYNDTNSYRAAVKPSTKYIVEFDVKDLDSSELAQFFTFYYQDKGTTASAVKPHDGWRAGSWPASADGHYEIEFETPSDAKYLGMRFGTFKTGTNITFSNISIYEKANKDVIDSITNREIRELITNNLALYTPTRIGYTFAGWVDADKKAVTADTIKNNNAVTSIFSTWTANKYKVIWKNEDGTVLETDTDVPYGTTPVYNGATPEKAADAQYTYTFAGWSPDVTKVTGDAIYTATYSKAVNKYTVTWKNDDGTVLETDTDVSYGTTPSYDGATPEKAADAQYTYTFAGWDSVIDNETLTITNTAKFISVTRTYTVIWKNHDGMNLTTSKVAYGETPVYNGATPTKAGNAQYSYTFSGWSPALAPVTGDAEYTATFTETLNKYTVTWVVDGNTVETDKNVPYGTTPVYDGETPTKEANAQYTYTFREWSPAITPVTGDATYTATFDQDLCQYTITWEYAGGETTTNVANYDTMPRAPANTAAYNDKDGHHTYSWPALKKVNGNNLYYKEQKSTAPHTEVTIPAVDATCTTDGSTAGVKCSVCNVVLTEPTVVPATGHSYTLVVTAPTCTDKGYTTHTCSKCQDSYVDSYVDAKGHSLGDWIVDKEATCITDGSKHKKCANCDYTETETISKTGEHKFEGDWEPYNDGEGTTHRQICTDDEKCTAYIEEACFGKGTSFAIIEENVSNHTETCKCGRTKKDSHAYGNWAADPENKDNNQGKMSRTCSECNFKQESDCTYEKTTNYKTPTCTEEGYQEWECTDINCTNGYTEILEASGHSFADTEYSWSEDNTTCIATRTCKRENCEHSETAEATITSTVKNAATCTEKGTTTYTATFTTDGNWAETQTKDVVDIDALNHAWAEEVTYNFAADGSTCTATRECTRKDCNTTETATATITSKVTTPATCTEKGTTTYTATFTETWANEQTTDVQDVPLAAHTNETIPAVPATCTQPGKTEGVKCSVCDEILTAQTTVDALGHKFGNWTANNDGTHTRVCTVCTDEAGRIENADCQYSEWEETKAPTCTAIGEKKKTCTVCTHVVTDTVPMLEHADKNEPLDGKCDACGRDICKHDNKTHKEAIAATCQNPGNIAYWHCNTCGRNYTDEACTVPADRVETSVDENNHTKVVKDDAVAATCTATGLTEGSHCEDCNKVVVKQEITDALGHNFGEATYNFADNGSTCIATRVCKNDATHKETTTATITSEVKNAATCTVDGWTTYTATFDVDWADSQTKDVQDIPALDHDWTVSYNFAEDGSACTATRVCTRDNSHVETATAEIASSVKTVATCTAKGTTTYTATFNVDWAETQIKDVEDLTALNHAWGEISYNWVSGNDGWTCTATRACTRDNCGHSENATAEIKSEVKTAATCTVDGWTTYTATFDVDWADSQTKNVQDIPALDHDWTVSYNFAEDGSTCTATRVCKNDSTHTETAEATISSAEKTPATCTEMGTTTYTATFSTEGNWAETQTKDVVDIPALAHNNKVHHAKVDATCVETGTIEYWSCSDCNKNFADEACTSEVETLTIGKNDNHVGYNTEVSRTPSTCNTKGSVTMKCACGDEKTTELGLDATNHESLSGFEAKAATCTEAGYEAYEECSACEYTTFKEIPATGHTEYNLGYVAPTCTTEGSNGTVVCSVCNVTISIGEIIPKAEHSYMTTPVQIIPANCATGQITIYKCKFCKATYRVVDEGSSAVMPHTIVEIGTVEPTCETAGWHIYFCTTCSTEVEKKIIDPIGHKDEDSNGYCDNCDSLYTDPDNQEVCTCLCHKQSGIMKFLYKIAHFLWKLFKINKSCACGVVHY